MFLNAMYGKQVKVTNCLPNKRNISLFSFTISGEGHLTQINFNASIKGDIMIINRVFGIVNTEFGIDLYIN